MRGTVFWDCDAFAAQHGRTGRDWRVDRRFSQGRDTVVASGLAPAGWAPYRNGGELSGLNLRGVADGQQQVESEQLPVEVGLNAVDVTVGKVFSV